jgi:hypothetical protein
MWNMVNPIIIFCKNHQLSLTKKNNHSLHSKSLNDDVSIAQRNIKNQHPPKKKPNKQTNKGNNAA